MKSVLTSLILMFAIATGAARGQTSTATNPLTEGALWEVHLNVHELFASPLGGLINKAILQKVLDKKHSVESFVEAIGLDPRTAVQEVILAGNSFDDTAPRIVADLGPSAGNLEGWLLAVPGYESETLSSGALLHSITPDEGESKRIWCAIPKDSTKSNRILIAALDRETVVQMVEFVEQSSLEQFSNRLEGGQLLAVSVNDVSKLPNMADSQDPGAAILRAIQSLSLNLGAASDTFTLNCEATAESPARAEQMHQLLTGMKAMAQLALPQEHPQGEQLASIVNSVSVQYRTGENKVQAQGQFGYDMVESLLEGSLGATQK